MLRDRFAGEASAAFDAINRSLPFDRVMVEEDIQGSRAHVAMLAACGILTADEGAELERGLAKVLELATSDGVPDDPESEDIHLWVEKQLGTICGPLAGKLHTGRSRNDQVALDQRLYLRGLVTTLAQGIADVLRALVTQARDHIDVVMPFYTHLQRAQPVLLAHHLLAHAEALWRDAGRLEDCLTRSDAICPLGAGAGAGTTYPIDPAQTADTLGFEGPVRNSLDSVAARDHILELAGAATICALHCSRIGEELVLWTSAEFGFARMSDAFSSTSSIMPQKRNADAAELARAYAGRILGRFTGFAATLKSLPLAYNKDLQESTLTLLQTGEDLLVALWATAGMIEGMTFDAERMRAAVEDPRGFILATDLADHLVRQGLPFREAHGQVAALVKWCEDHDKGLEQLSLEEIRAHCPGAADDVQAQALTIEGAINARAHLGGTAKAQVEARLAELEQNLSAE